MNALDYTVNPVTPQYQYPRKKPKLNVSMLPFYSDFYDKNIYIKMLLVSFLNKDVDSSC